jgi:hypothetical protein
MYFGRLINKQCMLNKKTVHFEWGMNSTVEGGISTVEWGLERYEK